MGRKRSKPVEFNPEPVKSKGPIVAAPNDPDPMPDPNSGRPGMDSGENPPRLDVRASKEAGEGPSGPSEPSKGGDGSSDVQGSESGSGDVLEAPTVASVGDGNNEPLTPGQSAANERVLEVKGDTAPTQPNPATSEVFEASVERPEKVKRYAVQRAMVGVYNPGAVVDAESLGIDPDRIDLFVKAGFLLPQ